MAVGLGETAVLVALDASEEDETRCTRFLVMRVQETEYVGFQACSFSPNDETLVFSTHVKRHGNEYENEDAVNRLDNVVYTMLWPTAGNIGEHMPRELSRCQIPTVRCPFIHELEALKAPSGQLLTPASSI